MGQRDGRIALFQNAALRGTSVSNLTLDLGLYRRPSRICAETIILKMLSAERRNVAARPSLIRRMRTQDACWSRDAMGRWRRRLGD